MKKQLFTKLRLLIFRVNLVTISSLVLVTALEPYSQTSLAQNSLTAEEIEKKCEEEIEQQE